MVWYQYVVRTGYIHYTVYFMYSSTILVLPSSEMFLRRHCFFHQICPEPVRLLDLHPHNLLYLFRAGKVIRNRSSSIIFIV